MKVIDTDIKEVRIIQPRIFEDSRGCFFESFSDQWFRENVCDTIFVQDNESKSKFGVLRGLHYQKGFFSQSKLLRVVRGKVVDVAVDIRKGSPTFGKHVAVELSEDNKLQLFIPRGFAHGFVVLSKEVIFQYKCDNYYAPNEEAGVAWNDALLNIDWRLNEEDIILSPKDKKNPILDEANFLFEYNIDYYEK